MSVLTHRGWPRGAPGPPFSSHGGCAQNGAEIGITTKKAHVHGVSFPATDDARAALESFAAGQVNYLQLVRPLVTLGREASGGGKRGPGSHAPRRLNWSERPANA